MAASSTRSRCSDTLAATATMRPPSTSCWASLSKWTPLNTRCPATVRVTYSTRKAWSRRPVYWRAGGATAAKPPTILSRTTELGNLKIELDESAAKAFDITFSTDNHTSGYTQAVTEPTEITRNIEGNESY